MMSWESAWGLTATNFRTGWNKQQRTKRTSPQSPPNICAVLRSAMEEQAQPQYSEVMMLAAAEKIAAQRHAAQQEAPVPSMAKPDDPTEEKKIAKTQTPQHHKQDGDKDNSGQTPQQQEASKEKVTAQDSESKHGENSEIPCEKDCHREARKIQLREDR